MSGAIVWFTGLPASGKTTLAERLRAQLAEHGRTAIVLDGDTMRDVLGVHGYGEADRAAFYRTLGQLAALIANQGVVVLVPATAPQREHRDPARRGDHRFVEVWVDAPLAECEARDFKDLYARAHRGELHDVPGVGVPFEPPEHPDVIARGGLDDAALAALEALLA
ncbi:MAG TPA: adenylyl-sulfate kinase [Kofleriaceae bacterium]|nr:adenylyl-sulfate kinase [Kofleriaceae bacterium]